MSTLLLRLAAPLQSYGGESKYDVRMTGKEPTKSAMVGLLAAARGRKREEPLEDLSRLRFGVRVDQEGTLIRDLHTARTEKTAYLTTRYYLSDAVFLAGFESGDEDFLATLDTALHHPVYPLFLGRRACPPTLPLSLGIRPLPLEEALRNEPWLAAKFRQGKCDPMLRIMMDSPDMSRGRAHDYPISFSSRCRQITFRGVQTGEYVNKSHDPMADQE
ncbi:MAG: type I-E CRISPR-associated protein Cas5/CasD [Clostridia bacterium]|nr:type I-E CRISPR-associated protein Cas5/CasD [Clostridia bacterium]